MSKDVNQALKEWQEALRLQDWDIKVVVMSEKDFVAKHSDEYDGFNDIDKEHRKSFIDIRGNALDQETTLVHELAHLIVENFNTGYEQAISMAPGEPCQQVLDGCRKFELEIMVCAITRALLNVRDIAQEEPKKAVQGGEDIEGCRQEDGRHEKAHEKV